MDVSVDDFKKRLQQKVQAGQVSMDDAKSLLAAKIHEVSSRDAIVRDKVAEQRRFTAKGGFIESAARSAAGSAGALGLHTFNSAALGYLPTVGAATDALGISSGAEQKLSDELEVSKTTNPVASGVGEILGLFLGPAGGLGKLAVKGATGIGLRGVGKGTAALVERTAGDEFLKRAGAQVLNNLVGGTAAITAFNLTENRSGEDASIGSRLADSIGVLNPATAGGALNYGASILFGGVTAKFTKTIQRDLKDLILKYELTTGEKVPIDVLSSNLRMEQFMDSASVNPSLQKSVQRVRDKIQKNLLKVVDDLGTGSGAGSRSSGVRSSDFSDDAAQAARRVQGTGDASRVDPTRSGPLSALATTERKTLQTAAFSSEKAKPISDAETQALRNGAAQIAREMRRNGENPAQFLAQLSDKLVRKTRPYAGRKVVPKGLQGVETAGRQARMARPARIEKRNITYGELENLRQHVAGIYSWSPKNMRPDPLNPKGADETRRAMKKFYDLVTQASYGNPSIESAMRMGEHFRQMEKTLNPEGSAQLLDDALASNFWTQKGLLGKNGRLAQLERLGTTTDLQKSRAWLFHKLLEQPGVFDDATGILNEKTLRNLTSKDGMFHRQVLDKALPGVLPELMDWATLATKMKRGILTPRGSQTAGRSVDILGPIARITGMVGMVLAASQNQWSVVGSLLGTAGLTELLMRTRRMVIEQSGPLGRGVANTLRGAPPQIGQGAVALQQAFAPSGSQNP